MKATDIGDDLAREIAGDNHIYYHLSSYVIFRKKGVIEELFCVSTTDIIDAINIVSHMESKNDGWSYWHSEEVVLFE